MRIDSAVYQGYTIPPYYDSLLGKLIVHGKTRTECLMRLRRALDEIQSRRGEFEAHIEARRAEGDA